MYSMHNDGKSVVAERFVRILKNKIYKHMTSISKNVYIYKLDDTVDEYNNTYHITIKMKPTDDKDPKFKVGYHVRISGYKNILAKGYTPNSSEEIFVIKEIKNKVPWTYVINDLMVKKLLEHFMKKNCKS